MSQKEKDAREENSALSHSPAVDQNSSLDTSQELDSEVVDESKKEEERKRLQALISHFSEEQLNRFELYRRAAFSKASVKRLIISSSGVAQINANVVIAMAGITKVYVGEIVEEALDVKKSWQEEGALQPKHIREAVRRLKDREGRLPFGRKRLFPF